MEEIYEKDKIEIKEENGKITYYNPEKKTHIREYSISLPLNGSFTSETNYLMKITRENSQLIEIICQDCSIVLYVLANIFFVTGVVCYISGKILLVGLFLIGMFVCVYPALHLPKVFEYYQNTRCGKCGKYLACKEYKNRDVRETSTPDTCTLTEIRYYMCSQCGRETLRNYEVHPAEKGKISHQKAYCKKCKKEGAVEYENPDIIYRGNITVTKHYYRCEYCGYYEFKKKQKRK